MTMGGFLKDSADYTSDYFPHSFITVTMCKGVEGFTDQCSIIVNSVFSIDLTITVAIIMREGEGPITGATFLMSGLDSLAYIIRGNNLMNHLVVGLHQRTIHHINDDRYHSWGVIITLQRY